ncbi:MAG: hypothetical protein HYT48_03375 [Candidatus Vogelbacteria bacterium]|nr:hypothetical protein [Candidatus Vogelbacteria bacterium]
MPTRQELKQKIGESLLLFIDFLYAVVFGLIISETARKLTLSGSTLSDLAGTFTHVLAIMMAFYFLTWDWVHARILTIRNPYRGYTRFFIEIVIAFCAYSMAAQILDKGLLFLFYLAMVLLLGAWWAKKTLRGYSSSDDWVELKTIQTLQTIAGALVLAAFFFLHFVLHVTTVNSIIMFSVVVWWWVFLLFYEMGIPRVTGIGSGPGVPLLSRRDVRKIRGWLSRLNKWFS